MEGKEEEGDGAADKSDSFEREDAQGPKQNGRQFESK